MYQECTCNNHFYINCYLKNITPDTIMFQGLLGGPERIRTAVEAFAELCLATRPQDPFRMRK